MRWRLFVALRLLRSRRGRSGAGRLAVVGIAAAVMTLIVVLAVMNGLQAGTIEALRELSSFHIQIAPGGDARDARPEGGADRLAADVAAVQGVEAAVPFADLEVLARGFWPDHVGVQLRAIDSDWLERDLAAARALDVIAGAFSLGEPGSVVLGSELARTLGARPGDGVTVTHIPGGGIAPVAVDLRVTGIVRSGYFDADAAWAFTSRETAVRDLRYSGPLTIGVKISRPDRERPTMARVAAVVAAAGYADASIAPWRAFNRGMLSALQMEKGLLVTIVSLLFVVLGGTIYQLLRRSILVRRDEIAVLRATGASAHDVRRVFVLEGWIIGVTGALVGTLLGVVVASNVGAIFGLLDAAARRLAAGSGFSFSPMLFYIQGVPVRIVPREVALVAAGAVALAVLAARAAVGTVARRPPAELFRQEAG